MKQVDTPTDWISSDVVTMKPNGQERLCNDLKPFNKALKRNEYDARDSLKGVRYSTHLDAKNGSWHVTMKKAAS